MQLHDTYDPQNIFAKILRGEIPCAKVYEDELVLAIMDAFPQALGHTLVIPKAPARNVLDLPDHLAGAYFERVQKLARAVCKALTPDGLVLTQFSGSAAGQSVPHVHVHLIPRWHDKALGKHASGGRVELAELQIIAARIAAALDPGA